MDSALIKLLYGKSEKLTLEDRIAKNGTRFLKFTNPQFDRNKLMKYYIEGHNVNFVNSNVSPIYKNALYVFFNKKTVNLIYSTLQFIRVGTGLRKKDSPWMKHNTNHPPKQAIREWEAKIKASKKITPKSVFKFNAPMHSFRLNKKTEQLCEIFRSSEFKKDKWYHNKDKEIMNLHIEGMIEAIVATFCTEDYPIHGHIDASDKVKKSRLIAKVILSDIEQHLTKGKLK